jgi:hypothetical protein
MMASALAAMALAGCGATEARIVRRSEPPTAAPAPATTPPPPTLLPVAVPAALDFGRIDFAQPATAAVTVKPGRRTVRLGRTELRGGTAYELTGDTCSGTTLRPDSPGCRLEVTVLSRASGEFVARLVLPHDAGTLAVPVTATVPLSYEVTVTVRGGGSVTGDLAGLACSDTCRARIPQGSTLTLTASAPVRWGGDCAGTAPTCRLLVSTPRQVTADLG